MNLLNRFLSCFLSGPLKLWLTVDRFGQSISIREAGTGAAAEPPALGKRGKEVGESSEQTKRGETAPLNEIREYKSGLLLKGFRPGLSRGPVIISHRWCFALMGGKTKLSQASGLEILDWRSEELEPANAVHRV